jgi:hypothetical protein
MRARLLISTLAVAVCGASAAQAVASGALHIRAGLYAPSASETTLDDYSDGGVNIEVAKGGKKITEAGVSCYTGSAPTGGLPANDEVTIRVPHAIHRRYASRRRRCGLVRALRWTSARSDPKQG